MRQQQFRITGVVQGVGFRPFVYRLAIENDLYGTVLNDSDGVLIEAQGKHEALARFAEQLQSQTPPLAHITQLTINDCDITQTFSDFRIIGSHDNGTASTLVPVDGHVCDDCLAELNNPDDRRYRYPFINCTNCGPRFSIIKTLPYDRQQTTMSAFTLCEACRAEYENPLSRRYHAQPIACHDCGPPLQWLSDDVECFDDSALQCAKTALAQGKIVAIKSVGGFHLAVDAKNDTAVNRLRQRKHRAAKPFAIMVDSLKTAQSLALISPLEADYLTASGRPIVLLKKRQHLLLSGAVAPNNPSLGIMLPSAPLHHLLFDDTLTAIVMTSGNVSGQPIAFTNDSALADLSAIADGFLLNDRDIFMRVDDSVLRVSESPELDKPLITWFRRGRGYAPYPITVPVDDTEPVISPIVSPIISTGSELKNTIAFLRGNQAYISQHIGDLKNPEIVASQQLISEHLTHLYQLQTDTLACDAHPDFAHRAEATFADKHCVSVQHHHAHMAACMADNGLTGNTLGVIFDGVGYSSDGHSNNHLWGGEFLLGDYAHVKRVAHLADITLIGGDKAVREPIRIAWGLLAQSGLRKEIPQLPAFANTEPSALSIYQQMYDKSLNTFNTSSIGRLFDGVSALLNVCTRVQYEAQAAIELEGLLNRDFTMADGYAFSINDKHLVDYRPVVLAVVQDVKNGMATATISRKFHTAVVQMIVTVCQQLQRNNDFQQVVLSGGVFLNEFITVNALIALNNNGIRAFSHQNVPTGDGGIALGQLLVASRTINPT